MGDRVNGGPRAQIAVQVFDPKRGFCFNSRFPEQLGRALRERTVRARNGAASPPGAWGAIQAAQFVTHLLAEIAPALSPAHDGSHSS
jgi:hypothetical protein